MLTQSMNQKQNNRHRVQHNYHDYSQATPPLRNNAFCKTPEQNNYDDLSVNTTLGKRGSRLKKFPMKLHALLELAHAEGFSDIISWKVHGRAFAVNNVEAFVVRIMPLYFQQSKIRSFFRQLNLYGFLRITEGRDRGAYYHELFLRGMPFLAARILRQKVKGTQVKGIPSPETEPNFYSMPFVMLTSSLPPMIVSGALNVNSERIMHLSSSYQPVYNPKNDIVNKIYSYLSPNSGTFSHDGKSTVCVHRSSVFHANDSNTLHDGSGNIMFDMIPSEISLTGFSLFDDENSCMSQIPNNPAELVKNARDTLFDKANSFNDDFSQQEMGDLFDGSMQVYSWQECELLCALLQDTSS